MDALQLNGFGVPVVLVLEHGPGQVGARPALLQDWPVINSRF